MPSDVGFAVLSFYKRTIIFLTNFQTTFELPKTKRTNEALLIQLTTVPFVQAANAGLSLFVLDTSICLF
jgi:hypothetical protein